MDEDRSQGPDVPRVGFAIDYFPEFELVTMAGESSTRFESRGREGRKQYAPSVTVGGEQKGGVLPRARQEGPTDCSPMLQVPHR